MCYNRLAYHGTRLQELHQGIAITMAWSSPINSSRVVLPVWDWTEIGRQGGAFTIKLKVRKRYARRQTPDEDSIATGLTDVLVVCLVVGRVYMYPRSAEMQPLQAAECQHDCEGS